MDTQLSSSNVAEHVKQNSSDNNCCTETSTQNEKESSKRKELESLLTMWKLERLLDHLISENVFVEVLKIIKRHHIQKVIEKFDLGTQITFEYHLEEWRNSIGLPFNELKCTPREDIATRSSTPSCDNTSSTSVSFETSSHDKNVVTIPLATILNENVKCMHLAEYYDKFSRFDEEQRTSLVNTIANYFDGKGVPMSLAASYKLENEILSRFPNEKLEYYRTRKRGKLYNKYSNLKSTPRKGRVNTKTCELPKKSRIEVELVPESDSESCVNSLRYDDLTAEQFDNCWKACTKKRLLDIKHSNGTSEILEYWPMYKRPAGFRLIDMDFDSAFNNGDGLLKNWTICITKIIHFLNTENHIKDNSIKHSLCEITQENTSENGRDATIFYGLHGYFVPTDKTVLKDNAGIKRHVKYTLKDSQESFLFLGKTVLELEEHILHLKNRKTNIQPFILCVGNTISTISEIYVYFDDIKYPMKSMLRAVDICFKTTYLFNLNFPIASNMFWNFIETYFFKFKAVKTFPKVHILSNFLDLDEI